MREVSDLSIKEDQLVSETLTAAEVGGLVALRAREAAKAAAQAKLDYQVRFAEYGEEVKSRDGKVSEASIERTSVLDPDVNAAYAAHKEAEAEAAYWNNMVVFAMQRKSLIEILVKLEQTGA
jgi:hypothetical protein